MGKLKDSKLRVFVLSYDKPPKKDLIKDDIVRFLLGRKVRNIESYTDSTIHFEWPTPEYKLWYDSLEKQFPKMLFSINVITKHKTTGEQYFDYIKDGHIEKNFKIRLEELKVELGIKD